MTTAMTDAATTDLTIDTTATPAIDPAEFAALGEGHIAYVRPIRSDEVRELFPQAPEMSPGLDLFALLSASGAPIMLTDSREVAVANAMAHQLYPVSLH